MKIGIQTWGSEGDIRPFAVLAQGLAKSGHDVDLVYTSVEGREYPEYGESGGFPARAVGGRYFLDHREDHAKGFASLVRA